MPHADLVFTGGPVFTANTVRSRTTAVAVGGGRIVAVGDDHVRTLIGPSTEVVDLGGRMLVPGFQDAHVHPVSGGLDLMRCDLNEGTTEAEYLDIIAAYAAANPEEGWISGGGWGMSAFAGGTPTAAALDRVLPDRPAFLPNRDGHGAWVNSAAPSATFLELQGWSLCTGPAKQLSSCAPPGTVALTDTSVIGAVQFDPVASQ